MIYIMLENTKLSLAIAKKIEILKQPVKFFDLTKDKTIFEFINQTKIRPNIIVIEATNKKITSSVWENMLFELSRKTTVIICAHKTIFSQNTIPWAYEININDKFVIKKILKICEKLTTLKDSKKPSKFFIPFFSHEIARKWLKTEGALSIISIHTNLFEKIGIDYGKKTMDKLNLFFSRTLYNLWGNRGQFRKNDYLCQNKEDKYTYYILLSPPRHELLPVHEPGHLDLLVKKLHTKIESIIIKSTLKKGSTQLFSSHLQQIPEFSIGHATIIEADFSDPKTRIEKLIKSSTKNAKILGQIHSCTQKELLQYLICSKNLLIPYYQAVFRVKSMTYKQFKKSHESKSIASIKNHIYGFEALIRSNLKKSNKITQAKLNQYIDISCITPDVLFHIAKKTDQEIELDQYCMQKSIDDFKNLPGVLFTNVLPRNYYNISQIINNFKNQKDIIFEISEKEIINNYLLLQETRNKLKKNNHQIAVDDFGKGYADLDKVLQIKPDIIKIDRSIVHNINKDPNKGYYLKALHEAAKTSGSLTLIEGVETFEEFKFIKKIGIDLIQGFALHKPERANAIAKVLKDSD